MPTVVAEPKKPSEMSFGQRTRELMEMERQEQEQIHRERKSPFSNFYQVNRNNSDYLRSCLRENPKALDLLFFIFDHMDKYNALMCSYKVFQEALGIGQATIARAIKYLKDHGFLYVYKTGSSNVYVANKNLVWSSWGSNWEYCEFPANVILSKSEQEERAAEVLDKKIKATALKAEG